MFKIIKEIDDFNANEPFTIYKNKEVWIPLECFDIMSNMYEISNFSRIRTIRERVYPDLIINKDGYYDIRLRCNNGRLKTYRHHRLVGSAFCVQMHETHNIINHIDSDRLNNDFRNLEWCTQQMNVQHAYNKGRMHAKPGEKHFNSIYTDEFVDTVCNLMNQGLSNNQIFEVLNLEKTIQLQKLFGKIRQRRTHLDISSKYPNITMTQKYKHFDDDTVHKICVLFEQYPTMSYKEVINILGLQPGRQTEKALSRIKMRDCYTDISCLYNW